MKRSFFLVLVLICAGFVSSNALANEESWDQGFYVLAGAGLTQLNNDNHVVTAKKFSKGYELSYGLTLGWDANMWVRPLLNVTYATATSSAGVAGGAAGGFAAGTFPVETAREHALDITLANRFTLPYFVDAFTDKSVKILPYLKVGGTAHALFVNAPTDANKTGAFGGGPAVGIGTQFLVWKGLAINIDFTEHLIFQKEFKQTIAGTSTKVTDGGFKPRFAVMGGIGWHF